MEFELRNPFTGELFRQYPAHEAAGIEAIVRRANSAYTEWRQVPIADRCLLSAKLASVLRQRLEELAQLMTQEMGKPITQARSEMEKCATLCDYYSENAGIFLADQQIATSVAESFVSYRPLGVVLGIMPWNFPFWQVFRFGVPALLAGNSCLLKHAPNVPGCAEALEAIFAQSGFPRDVFLNLRASVSNVGKLISDSRIAGISLTGSTRAGKSVGQIAGRELKKVVLELGGNDAYVVLHDADIDLAAEACVTSRLLNSGQSCIAAKRFIVAPEIASDFQSAVLAAMRAAIVGDPADSQTDVGPLARLDLRDTLAAQVRESIDAGADLVLGGKISSGAGAIYPTTLLTRVTRGMPAYHEELFGPVASIVVAADEQDAITIANDSTYGLGAAVFTRDVERGRRIARDQLLAGSCFVNSFVVSDPRLPFGGIKQSGLGRELSSWGIREFTNTKTISIA